MNSGAQSVAALSIASAFALIASDYFKADPEPKFYGKWMTDVPA